jgi:predicted enzyme related to lactoylglutathione lyase
MSNTTSHPHGTFSWVDLQTTDGAAAKAFYTSLFGWQGVDMSLPDGGVYTMLQQDGKDVAGLGEMPAEQKAQGMPAVWNSYISVDDVDAAAAKVGPLGGTVIVPPFDVMDAGRMAVVQDPTGAFVSLWQTKNHKGGGIFNVPNTMSWNELATRDANAAKTFYTSLVGWEAQTDAQGYTVWLNRGRMNGGMMQMDAAWGDMPPHWAVYFSVADCAATAEKAQALGGTLLRPPFAAGDVGTVAVLQDPQGAVFMIIQMDSPDTTMP